MRISLKKRSIAYCLFLAIALVLWTFDYAGAPVRYRLGAGDEINLTAITKINQGAGSGLDADKVDGKDASDFIASGAGGIKDTDIDWGLSSGQVNTDDIPEGSANKYFNGKGLKDLADTPGSYTGQSGKVVAVKSTEDGLEFTTAASSGETNTASNVGTGGVGPFKQKTGVDLELKKINAGSNKVTVTDDTGNNEIDIDVAEANIVHDNLSGAGTNTHAQIDTHLGSTSNPHSVTAAQLGAEETSNKNAAGGYAGLDGSSKLTGSQQTYGTSANTACESNDSRLSDSRAPTAHKTSHETGGGDALSGDVDATARTTVRKNTGADVGSRRRLNLIPGSNVTITVVDDATDEEVDITIASSGGGGDTAVLENNILLNAFRIAVNGALTQYNMQDGIVDEYEDESGVDTGSATGQTYDAANDLYYPSLALEDSETYGTGGTDDDGEYSLPVPADVVAINYGAGGTDDDGQHDMGIAGDVEVDSYSESNRDAYWTTYSGVRRQVGQAFNLSASGTLNKVKFYLSKSGSPTGNCLVKLYAATGTLGTDAKPTGSILATSDTLDVSTLTGTYVLKTFTFSTPYAASAGDYCVVLEYDGGDASNFLRPGGAWASPTHAGNTFDAANVGGPWTADASGDMCFYIYKAGDDTQVAQSFTVGGSDITATKVRAYMLQTGSADASVECRIETDNSNKPSGTLAFANATKTITAASISGTAAWTEFALTASGTLSASTKYWRVIKRVSSPTTGTVSVRYDGSSPSYANGACAVSTDAGSNWTVHDSSPNHDCLFEIYKPGQHTHYAQKITLPSSQTLAQIRFYMRESGCDGNVKVEIQGNDATGGDHPNGTVLTSVSITASSITDTNGWNIGDFTNYAAGAIKVWPVIYRDSDTAGTLYIRYDGSSPGYSGGGTNTSTDEGGTWGTEDTAKDILFRLEELSEGMTLPSVAFTADAQPGSVRLVLFEEDVDAVTLNTDLKVFASRDNGTNYTQVTLADEGNYESSKRILAGTLDISGQPAGTSMKYKVETLNSKDLKLHGIGYTWN